ncbi:MAG TPA: C4-type zinc ribbon domain-containing protein [Candidatus Kapabacteria bacterium]|nr:C4-type zinc ribbon domain-containing protein [Candidatus Kapabacteria bacterium]
MESQIYTIAQIATIDERLEELHEDYGSLPEQIKIKEANYSEKKNLVDDTQHIIDEIVSFVAKAKVTLVELKDKEEKLTQQQFQVRNNKEFDAISNEINHLKSEHEHLSNELRTSGVKQENLKAIIESQTKDLNIAQADLDDIYAEEKKIVGDQEEEIAKLRNIRNNYVKDIKAKFLKDYDRIRTSHTDAAVRIKKNSCSGCFSFLPAQLIVEVRNNPNTIYNCENCGRILIPEDLYLEDID